MKNSEAVSSSAAISVEVSTRAEEMRALALCLALPSTARVVAILGMYELKPPNYEYDTAANVSLRLVRALRTMRSNSLSSGFCQKPGGARPFCSP